jgi:hypothetical protein
MFHPLVGTLTRVLNYKTTSLLIPCPVRTEMLKSDFLSCGDGGEEEGADASHGGHLPHHAHSQQHPLSYVRLSGAHGLIDRFILFDGCTL